MFFLSIFYKRALLPSPVEFPPSPSTSRPRSILKAHFQRKKAISASQPKFAPRAQTRQRMEPGLLCGNVGNRRFSIFPHMAGRQSNQPLGQTLAVRTNPPRQTGLAVRRSPGAQQPQGHAVPRLHFVHIVPPMTNRGDDGRFFPRSAFCLCCVHIFRRLRAGYGRPSGRPRR